LKFQLFESHNKELITYFALFGLMFIVGQFEHPSNLLYIDHRAKIGYLAFIAFMIAFGPTLVIEEIKIFKHRRKSTKDTK